MYVQGHLKTFQPMESRSTMRRFRRAVPIKVVYVEPSFGIRIQYTDRSRTENRGRPKCAKCVRNERDHLQLSLRVAPSEAGVSHLQLGSEAQMTSLPLFLMYLYSIVVLAGKARVTLYPGFVSKTKKTGQISVRTLTVPGGITRRRERDRIIW